MKLETMSSTILLRRYHMILSTRQNQILLLLLYFQNQKKGRKLQQKLQTFLHLHPHWRQSRNSPTLQDQESQRERTLEGQPVYIVTFTCKLVIKTLLQSGFVDYQSEKLNFEHYILCTRAK